VAKKEQEACHPALTIGYHRRGNGKEGLRMAKVYSFHNIALKPGVDGRDFERFFQEEVKPAHATDGMSVRLLKGERGERRGLYLLVLEFESDALSSPAIAEDGSLNRRAADELTRWIAAENPLPASWDGYATPIGALYTEYRECR
jgi:hypothetical protein